METAARRRKERHNHQTLSEPLEVGQKVYLKDLGVRGRNKIQDVWSPTDYEVVRAPGQGGVVYSIAPVNDLNRERSVHWTLLKPGLPEMTTRKAIENEGLWGIVRLTLLNN